MGGLVGEDASALPRPGAAPRVGAAWIMASQTFNDTASGFSTSTCTPARQAATAGSEWKGCGVQTTATSTSLRNEPRSLKARTP